MAASLHSTLRATRAELIWYNLGNEPSPSIDFISGVIAGAAGLIVGQPFDVVKVRYQTPEYAGRYSSTFKALGSIVKEEQLRGLFKGVTSPMAGIAFINGVVFTSYSILMRIQLPRDTSGVAEDKEPSLWQICFAGAGSGVVGSLLTCPTELVKIRQQSAPPHLNPSVVDVCRHILRTDGMRGLYRGFSATAIRDLAYGPYFCTYEAACRFFKSLKPPPPPPPPSSRHRHHDSLIEEAEAELSSGLTWAELMAAGGIAGVTAWLVTFPFDVFKTRMQAESWTDTSGTRRSPTLRQVIRTTIAKEGWRTCFAGLGPTLIRAMPVNMITFLTFEACVSSLSSTL